MTSQRTILITTALPYANSDLHLGHLLEHTQSNIWYRFQKLSGHTCFSICGDDAHGTAITLSAEKQGITPEKLIENIHQDRLSDFKNFHIIFDQYYTTHSPENKSLTKEIYLTLKKAGHIKRQTITQAFDNEKQMFLADRYIKGDCPKCGSHEQYGDNCDQCGATYSALELKNSYSVLSGTTPVAKKSEHLFFSLEAFATPLKTWLNDGAVSKEIKNKLNEWLQSDLKAWNISRDAPYFGFEIPEEKNKYFYVWMDAPIGYMSSFKFFCEKNKNLSVRFEDFWCKESSYEVHHFIGKDIINFHCLFWPALLIGAHFRLPTKVHTHGYLTINGEKMSKSRGTFITAKTYLKYCDPEPLRYYFASKISPGIQDYDFNIDDFIHKFNSDIIGKLINIASRCAVFINQNFHHKLSAQLFDPPILLSFQQAAQSIAAHYEQGDFNKAIRCIMELADQANAWINEQKPWVIRHNPDQQNQLQNICSIGLHLFRLLVLYIKPIIPTIAEKAEDFLNIPPMTWQDHKKLLLDHTIKPFTPLATRIEKKRVEQMLGCKDDKKETTPKIQKSDSWLERFPLGKEIDLTAFNNIDLRVAKVISCVPIEKTQLLKFEVDLGEKALRTIFSKIKKYYQPDTLVGKHVIVIANLKPRKMSFGTSEGMILCAGNEIPFLLEAPQKTEPGMPIQ